jgi:branched-chain amino acid transport system ATP-binding protein
VSELRLESVSVRFGGVQALDEVSLEVLGGTVHGLIGPNGAGKTTLFNVVTGLARPTAGRVLVAGRDVTRLPPHRRARLGTARTFQRLELFGTLTARENVLVASESFHSLREGRHSAARAADEALERAGSVAVADRKVDTLPVGTARLVELARALAGSPRLLLLDEPASGLDEEETAALAGVVRRLASEGMAVLLVEHDMSLVMGSCDTVDVLDRGRVIASGTPAEVRASAVVREAYLGADPDSPGDAGGSA